MSERLALISGFGPFESFGRNPSGEVARALARSPPPGLQVVSGEIPVSFARAPAAWDELLEGLDGARPILFLGLGVQRRAGFRLERRARPRLKLVPRVDVDGRLPREFSRAGPTLATEFALEPLLARLEARGVADAWISESAGGYVCEWIYHHILTRGRERGTAAFFVHVPPERFAPLERQIEVVRWILEALTS